MTSLGRMLKRDERPRSKRLVLLALAGLTVIVGFAVAPVEQGVFRFTFRPADAGANPATASLALARPAADELHVVLPCDEETSFATFTPAPWLNRRGSLVFPDLGGGVAMDVTGDEVLVRIGDDRFLRVGASPGPGCLAELDYVDGTWTLSVRGETTAETGPPPRVSEATFVGPSATSVDSRVTVATRELGTSPSLLQLALMVAGTVVLALAAREIGKTGPRLRMSLGLIRTWLSAHVGVVDFAVVAALGAWTILIPAGLDDGWVADRVNSYGTYGAFSGIYTVGGAPLPMGYWLEWLQHLWFGLGSSAVVMRLPAMFVGVGTWATMRAVARRLGEADRVASRWVMAAVFITIFGAWDVTLRPEPVIALLVMVSLLSAVRFAQGERGRLLVVWAAVGALGVTAHPAGVVVLAPVVVALPRMWRWMRSSQEAMRVGVATALLFGSFVLLSFTFDANVAAKIDSIEQSQTTAHSLGVAQEVLRYRLLDQQPYAAAMRRVAVAFIVIAPVAFFLRRRRGQGLSNLPAWSLILALALLAVTPSKWPWHLGGFAGLAALVLAMEVAKIDRERWAVAMLGVVGAMSWAWTLSLSWNAFDLRTQEWWPGATNLFPFRLSSLVAWAVAAGVVALVWRGVQASAIRWRMWFPLEVFVLLAAGVVLFVTTFTFWSDVMRTDGWTFGRQNIKALLGRVTCGLGDEIVLPAPGSLHAIEKVSAPSDAADLVAGRSGFGDQGGFEEAGYPKNPLDIVPVAPDAESVGSWIATGSSGGENGVSYRSEWRSLDDGDEIVVIFAVGTFAQDTSPEASAAAVQFGRAAPTGIVDVALEPAILAGEYVDWTMVTFERPSGSDHVRLLLRDETTSDNATWVAATLPMAARTETLGVVANSSDTEILIATPLGMYFPCVDPPQFENTVVPEPGVVVQMWSRMWQTTFSGAAASDRYFRIPVELDPPARDTRYGAHVGDIEDFLFVSQAYLTGVPARVNGEFSLGG